MKTAYCDPKQNINKCDTKLKQQKRKSAIMAFTNFAVLTTLILILITCEPALAQSEVDLIADALEVTQAVQNLSNAVRLVAGKRTFIRLFGHSSSGYHVTTAWVRLRKGANEEWLSPLNPDRESLVWDGLTVFDLGNAIRDDWGFLFELPGGFRDGTVEITGFLNPLNNMPMENDPTNNSVSQNITFEEVPPLILDLYGVNYTIGSTIFTPQWPDVRQTVLWLLAAYPIDDLRVTLRRLSWGIASNRINSDGVLVLTSPNCERLNRSLISTALVESRLLAIVNRYGSLRPDILRHLRILGLVSDSRGFMRGCSDGIPSLVASGPAGNFSWGWDSDGSYADWYTGHELAHTLGRGHANFCDAEGGVPFPYPGGLIYDRRAPESNRTYGFDIGTRSVYRAGVFDNMTYCSLESQGLWNSDFTYEGIMNFLQGGITSAIGSSSSAGGDALPVAGPSEFPNSDEPSPAILYLLIVGSIEPSTDKAELDPIFTVPVTDTLLLPAPGKYAIVLRGKDDSELARFPFKPTEAHSGPPAPGITEKTPEISYLSIHEFIPHIQGTQHIDIEGPDGNSLTSITAGASPPSVTLISPNEGQISESNFFTVNWEVEDLDGDTLTSLVQFSPDDGKTWQSISMPTKESSIEVDRDNVNASDTARFRVMVTDGINTSSDESDSTIKIVSREPLLEIISPRDGDVVVTGDMLNLEAIAIGDIGTLYGEQLKWVSDLDGILGHGRQITTAAQSVGLHSITLEANDGQGGVTIEKVLISIVANVGDLPKHPDKLRASPDIITLISANGIEEARILVYEQNYHGISWSAEVSEPWLILNQYNGTTPTEIVVKVDKAKLQADFDGDGEVSIRFISTDLPNDEAFVRVSLIVDKCEGDFEPDEDVDGSDLLALTIGQVIVSLANFAEDFGRINCP